MEDLSKYTNLQRRNGRYYFRVRVPLDLIDTIGKREIKKSLGTSELATAKTRLPIEQLKADELFHNARAKTQTNGTTPTQPPLLSRDEIERRVILWFQEESQRQAIQDDADRLGICNDDQMQILENLHAEQLALDSSSESTYQHSITPVLNKLFGESDSSTQQTASRATHQAQVELLYRRLARFGELHNREPFILFTRSANQYTEIAPIKGTSWGELLRI